jgi:replicative DNA helicase
MKWMDVTEVVVGFALHKKLDPDIINPEDCYPPYGEIIPILRDGKDVSDVVSKVGYTTVRTAMEAAEHINGELKPIEWLKVLKTAASQAQTAAKLSKVVKDLEEGKEVDAGLALKALSMMEDGYRELTPMSEIKEEENVWIPTGWEPIDGNVGGLVKAGLLTIGASPGVGKTTLLLKIATSMVKKYKKSKVALFTLEMTTGQITKRALELADISDNEKSRILLGDSAYGINEIYAVSSRLASSEKISMIGVDFADLLIEGEQSEATMGIIYKTLATLARKTGVPVVLISQLSRTTYAGGTPKVNHLRYSGMAEAMSALIFLIYNPHNILADFGGKSELENVPGRGYLIVGKSRFGFKQGGPGAIMIDWEGISGWGDKSIGWFPINT